MLILLRKTLFFLGNEICFYSIMNLLGFICIVLLMKRWSRSYFEDNKRQNTSVTFFLSSRVPGLKYNKI